MTNAALISRLAEAKEGSRELSDEVLVELGWQYEANSYASGELQWGGGGLWRDLTEVGRAASSPRPDPSRNLQDAVDLVPEGWPEGRISWPGRDSGYLKANARAELHHMLSSGGGPREIGFAATPALALCVAILKALETENGDG